MENLETSSQQGECATATRASYTTLTPNRTFLNILPREIRDMIYAFVIGDHTIHIKSDVILPKCDLEDNKDEEDDEDDKDNKDHEDDEDGEDDEDIEHNEDDGDEDNEDDENDEDDESDDEDHVWQYYDDDDEDDGENYPAELSETIHDDRGLLYHTICDMELLHPKDAQKYRIRSQEAIGNRGSRARSKLVVSTFKNVNCPGRPGPNLESGTSGSLGGVENHTGQVKLAFLKVNKQLYEEAATMLYSTKTFGFDDATTFAQFFSMKCNCRAEPPTSTNGTDLITTKRNSIRSIHIRAKTNLCLFQKLQWMGALDAASFVLPKLEKIRVLFDLCREGMEHHVDGTFWQFYRHRNGFPNLKTAEVRVATHFLPLLTLEDANEEPSHNRSEGPWRVLLLEAIIGYHIDVLFGASALDPASPEGGNAAFLTS